MKIGESSGFIPQQRQWPGGCAPPRSRPGAHPEGPAAAGLDPNAAEGRVEGVSTNSIITVSISYPVP